MADPVTNAANSVKDTVKRNFNLKTVFTLGAFGVAATAGGMLLAPFFATSAGAAVAHAAATNGTVLTSFWSPLFTSVTGEVGVTAGLGKMASGVGALGKSAFAVAGSTVKTAFASHGSLEATWAATKTAWAAPPGMAFAPT